MKYYEVDSYGKTYDVRIEANRYMDNNTLAISLICSTGEPFCNLTVNLFESAIWGDKDTAFVDTNNCPWAEEFIAEHELGEPVGYSASSGFCTYPLYKFNLEKVLDN